MNRIVRAIWTLAFAAALPLSAAAQGAAAGTEGAYQWVPARLIPNEFGLPNGTWANASVRDCIRKCSADRNCTGFSVQKAFGDALNAGCKDGLCDKKTECHAKAAYGASKLWTPTDAEIRVPKVDPKSNAWIAGWGSVVKK